MAKIGDLTPKQRDLIRQNWKLVEDKGLSDVAVSMYIKLFTDHPYLQPLFAFAAKKETIEELKTSPRLRRHATGAFNAIGTAISRLDNILTAVPDLIALGALHYKYNIKPEYFKPLGEALLYAIGEACGGALGNEAVQAWLAVYAIVEMTMVSGYEAAKSSAEAH